VKAVVEDRFERKAHQLVVLNVLIESAEGRAIEFVRPHSDLASPAQIINYGRRKIHLSARLHRVLRSGRHGVSDGSRHPTISKVRRNDGECVREEVRLSHGASIAIPQASRKTVPVSDHRRLAQKAAVFIPPSRRNAGLFRSGRSWSGNPLSWKATAKYCPGIGKGELIQIGTAMEMTEEQRLAYPEMYK